MSVYETSIGDDLQNGIASTVDAATRARNAAKKAAKAVKKATELSPWQIRRRITLAVLGILSVLIFFIVFCAPTALFESLQKYTDILQNAYYEKYYTSEGGRQMAEYEANAKVAEILWTTIVKDIDQLQEIYMAGVTGETIYYSSDDLEVMSGTEALKTVYEKRIKIVQDKFETRAKEISGAIIAMDHSADNYFYEKYKEDAVEYLALADTNKVTYGGSSANVTVQPVSKREAIKIIALYSALYNCDPERIVPYELARWLGYRDYGEAEATIDGSFYTPIVDPGQHQGYIGFTVGDVQSLSVMMWQGSFMPSYLMQEAAAYREKEDADPNKYRYNECAAIDLLMMVSSEPFATVIPTVEKTERTEIHTTYVQKWGWALMTETEFRKMGYGKISQNTPTEPKPELPASAKAGQKYYWVYASFPETVTNTKYDYTLSYIYEVSISMRSVALLEELAGFYEMDDEYTGLQELDRLIKMKQLVNANDGQLRPGRGTL